MSHAEPLATATATCSAGAYSTNLNLASLSDGNYILLANHSDANNVAANPAAATLLIDTAAPTVAISTPAAINVANLTSYNISGSCSENGRTVTVAAGGITATSNCLVSTYSVSMNLSSLADGTVTISATQTDSVGNSATASSSATKNSVVAVTINTPATISFGNQAAYAVSGSCSASGSFYGTVAVTVGSVSGSASCVSGSYTVTGLNVSALGDGSKTITAVHTYGVVSSAVQTTSATKSTAVSLSISTPSAISLTNMSSYGLSGACSQASGSVTVDLGGVTMSGSCSSYAWAVSGMDLSGLANTTYTISATYTYSGSSATQTAFVTKNSNITATINTPVMINASSASSYTVAGSCSANGGSVAISIDGGGDTAVTATTSCSSGTYTLVGFNVSSLTDGTKTIHVTHTYSAASVTTTASVVKNVNQFIALAGSITTTPVTYTNVASYPVTGTCSDSGTTVALTAASSGGSASASPVCSAGTFLANMNLYQLPHGRVTITATHSGMSTTTTTYFYDNLAGLSTMFNQNSAATTAALTSKYSIPATFGVGNTGIADSSLFGLGVGNTGIGNLLTTNLSGATPVPYTGGIVRDGASLFGAGSNYITNVTGGLFVLAASGANITAFNIATNYATAPTINNSSFALTIDGRSYMVHYRIIGSGSPSLNEMVVLPGGSGTSAISQTADPISYDFTVSGLTGQSSLLYLAAARTTSSGFTEAEMTSFLTAYLKLYQFTTLPTYVASNAAQLSQYFTSQHMITYDMGTNNPSFPYVGSSDYKPYGMSDSGNDMYDNGNYLYPTITGYSQILTPETLGSTIDGSQYFGTGSSYFTAMGGGFWFMGAYNVSISSFNIQGNLGSDGSGLSTNGCNSLTTASNVPFVVCYEIDYNAGDPSINQMVIIPGATAGDGITATSDGVASGNNNFTVGNLTTHRKLLYILTAKLGGVAIDTTNIQNIATKYMELSGLN